MSLSVGETWEMQPVFRFLAADTPMLLYNPAFYLRWRPSESRNHSPGDSSSGGSLSINSDSMTSLSKHLSKVRMLPWTNHPAPWDSLRQILTYESKQKTAETFSLLVAFSKIPRWSSLINWTWPCGWGLISLNIIWGMLTLYNQSGIIKSNT